MENKICVLCKDEDSNKYEVWEKLNGLLNFIDTFTDMNEAIKFCETNLYKIENYYEDKGQYK